MKSAMWNRWQSVWGRPGLPARGKDAVGQSRGRSPGRWHGGRGKSRWQRGLASWWILILIPWVIAGAAEEGDREDDATGADPEERQAAEDLEEIPLEAVGDGVYRLGKVRLDKTSQEIRFPATVNMRERLIEYAVVHTTGKAHESLFVTEVPPHRIHVAALLIGASETKVTARRGSEQTEEADPEPIRDPTAEAIDGDRVTVWVEWDDPESGQPREVSLGEWIEDQERDAPLNGGPWVYNGSRIRYGHFMAEREGSIIAIIADPNALINNPDPRRVSDEIWRPRTDRIPDLQTEVRIGIRWTENGRSGDDPTTGQDEPSDHSENPER